MYFEEALFSYLSTYSSLATLVTTGSKKKIYPVTAPQGTALPYVTFNRIITPRYPAFKYDATITSPTFQFSCFGGTYATSKAIAYNLIAALQDYSGVMGGTGGVSVQAVLIVDENDLYDTQAKEHYVVVDVQFFYNE